MTRAYTPNQYQRAANHARIESRAGSNSEKWGCFSRLFLGIMTLAIIGGFGIGYLSGRI